MSRRNLYWDSSDTVSALICGVGLLCALIMLAYALIVAINIDAESVSSAAPAVEVAPVATALPRGEPVVFIVPVAPTVAPAPVEVIKPAAAPAAAVEVAPQAPKPDEPWFEWPVINIPVWFWFFAAMGAIAIIAFMMGANQVGIVMAILAIVVAAAVAAITWAIAEVQKLWVTEMSAGGMEFQAVRFVVAIVTFLILFIGLMTRIARRSDKDISRWELVGGQVLWDMVACAAIAFVPWSWGHPIIIWGVIVIAATITIGFGSAAATTSFFKLGKSGNRAVEVRDEGAINASFGILAGAYRLFSVPAIIWTVSNLVTGASW